MPIFVLRGASVGIVTPITASKCDRALGKIGLAVAAHSREGSRVLGPVLLTTLAIGPGLVNHEQLTFIVLAFSAIAAVLIDTSHRPKSHSR